MRSRLNRHAEHRAAVDFAMQVALASLWNPKASPDVVAGHSMGEVAALTPGVPSLSACGSSCSGTPH